MILRYRGLVFNLVQRVKIHSFVFIFGATNLLMVS